MSGIYIHIPFCKQKCNYCDFYSSTSINKQSDLINAICLELKQRKQWLENDVVNTIYFGGGTPSLLSKNETEKIINECYKHYNINNNPEITLEANPDDLNTSKIKDIAQTKINRLSIGIQSFNNKHLALMNRRHTGEQAIAVIKNCQNLGFNNISADLIYGLPNLTNKEWAENLLTFEYLNIQHLSAYHLTIEPNTVFYFMQKKGKIKPINEQTSINQFNTLTKWAKHNSFLHYEISNFAKNGFQSKHNSSYWQQKKYLGIGPSAHSFNIKTRTWNTPNLNQYIQKITKNTPAYEYEELSAIDKHNEFIMTRLRTCEGIVLNEFKQLFGINYTEQLLKNANNFIKENKLKLNNNIITLTHDGIFISDSILSELIQVE